MAERLTRAYAAAEGAALGGVLTASSAGTRAVVGNPIEPSAGLVLRGLGGDATGFVARQLVPRDIEKADLVLTMTRKHRDKVLQLSPRVMTRTFTLREAAALLKAADDDDLAADPNLDSRARLLSAVLTQRRGAGVVHRDRQRDDIPDPIGGSLDKFQKVGDAIAGALLPVLAALTARSVRPG
ncbi:MAG: hypothetical protein M3313_06790 [Actinomycetota bacterium]|nr:hypothetical protein [Actinomycetota bacterium]